MTMGKPMNPLHALICVAVAGAVVYKVFIAEPAPAPVQPTQYELLNQAMIDAADNARRHVAIELETVLGREPTIRERGKLLNDAQTAAELHGGDQGDCEHTSGFDSAVIVGTANGLDAKGSRVL
ncbi:hypothetical protein, partial [Aeromonas dhakensis]|uniref:hypothetical protein n=1 Tax=Aeromonas dhakensis TaxID=196024 RepID=UPI0005A893A3